MKNSLLLILFFATSLVEAKTLKGYCFESNVSLKSVRSHLSTILSPRDEVFERPSMNCLEVTVSSSREELFETWIYKRFKPIRIYKTDGVVENNQAMGQMPMCRMTVERVTRSDSNVDDVSVGSNNKLKNSRSKRSGVSQSSLLLTSGVKGRLRMDEQEIYVTCHVLGGSYRVELSLDHSNSSISTSVNTSKGSRINIGQMVEDLNNRSRNLDIKKGIVFQKEKGKSVSDYFLIIQQ